MARRPMPEADATETDVTDTDVAETDVTDTDDEVAAAIRRLSLGRFDLDCDAAPVLGTVGCIACEVHPHALHP